MGLCRTECSDACGEDAFRTVCGFASERESMISCQNSLSVCCRVAQFGLGIPSLQSGG